ncbi:helix-turn-helix domain-containing protein, partial [uncultured Ruminococcus sp.]|uniref:AraC family transcriptional regulator n=1 Tax=uncultured Ruminococcus sp. TaxID=165186 RepID=UPI0025E44ABC
LEPVIKYIKENYAYEITLAELAEILPMSEGQFSRVFKQTMKMSPIQYLMRYRILQSCKLLQDTDKKIGEIANLLLLKRELDLIGDKLHLVTVEDGEELDIIGHRVQFFDVESVKTKQFGFTMQYGNGKKLTCCGDEPFHECEREYVYGSDWLLHEAFCLYSQADIFKPYEKNHSTVADACKLAEELKIKNLVLYHTEDKNLSNRKSLYYDEGKKYYSGNLYIPNDLEVFEV